MEQTEADPISGEPGYMTSKTHTRLGSMMCITPSMNSFLQSRHNDTVRQLAEEMPAIAEVTKTNKPVVFGRKKISTNLRNENDWNFLNVPRKQTVTM